MCRYVFIQKIDAFSDSLSPFPSQEVSELAKICYIAEGMKNCNTTAGIENV